MKELLDLMDAVDLLSANRKPLDTILENPPPTEDENDAALFEAVKGIRTLAVAAEGVSQNFRDNQEQLLTALGLTRPQGPQTAEEIMQMIMGGAQRGPGSCLCGYCDDARDGAIEGDVVDRGIEGDPED